MEVLREWVGRRSGAKRRYRAGPVDGGRAGPSNVPLGRVRDRRDGQRQTEAAWSLRASQWGEGADALDRRGRGLPRLVGVSQRHCWRNKLPWQSGRVYDAILPREDAAMLGRQELPLTGQDYRPMQWRKLEASGLVVATQIDARQVGRLEK